MLVRPDLSAPCPLGAGIYAVPQARLIPPHRVATDTIWLSRPVSGAPETMQLPRRGHPAAPRVSLEMCG
jgi:hypothetical protein